MKQSQYFKIIAFISIVSTVLFTFNNCGDNFHMLAGQELLQHEASTMSKEIYINGVTENVYLTGRDLTFSADLETPMENPTYEWSYTINGQPQGCNLQSVAVPSMYKINCPTSTGELVVQLVVKSNVESIVAEPAKFILAQAPAAAPPANNDVQFSIPAGTGNKSWNTPNNPILAKVGQRIVITNNDSIPHRMHTGGQPCPHGANIMPGQTGVCVVNAVFNGSVYDHIHGTAARVYITTTAQ